MGIFRKFRKDRNPSPLQRRRGLGPNENRSIPLKVAIYWFLGFIGFTGLIVLIAFAGLTQSDPQIARDQVARDRVVADFSFSFESDVLTQRQVALARERIPPFYEVDIAPFEEFSRALNALEFDFAEFETNLQDLEGVNRMEAIRAFVREFSDERGMELPVEQTAVFLNETSPAQRNRLIQDAIDVLGSIYRNGIIDEDDPNFSGIGSFNVIPVQTEDDEIARVEIQRPYDARVSLRNELANMDVSDTVFNSLYEILSIGVQPNLEFDAEQTRTRRDEAAVKVNPVRVEIREGTTIIEPGVTVSALAYEKLVQYRQEQSTRAANRFFLDPTFQQRTLLTLMVLLTSVLLLQLGFPRLANDPRRLGTVALLILVNLLIFRFSLYLGNSDLFRGDHRIIGVLPYVAPLAFGPITAGILLGPILGALTAFIISAIFAIMLGEASFLFLAGMISSLVGIFLCHNIRLRTNVVRASFLAGVTLSGFILLHGALLDSDLAQIGRQIAAALISSSITGVVILGFLPLLERLFNYTTDITLLEYTDFNHPLLRRMQVEAPGSYHHSLMVANLSENAAAEIGANPLACRACALFHDIGKIVKPEYFTENQRSGRNPLIEQKPSMSAVIIKRHVKEGVELARKYKLPKVFVDVIRQHHGTSLIQYFYREAINRRERSQLPLFSDISAETVEENTYRYDGPKPDFVESAIILFADSIEAASRSLQKVNAQSVGELLDRIFQSRIEDGQLDECPLTLQQVAIIKQSFTRTLLNSLHTRIAYPSDEKDKEKEKRGKEGKEAEPKSTPPEENDKGDTDNQQV
ncbi:HD family phosphohydrolase [Puniceicoccus vermicola]|uniref:HDIG domain-containing protein n=1 Tax=Puniceicoccus vermicola TaxID=388746 RepID=A0A7X1AXN1_9BACT|nr:HDIG domain-containing metalloprotein [Puniceicoccus vermicola]MBC2600868.1 HDIG domain-containing protein [Puniceicoccus vermicola]